MPWRVACAVVLVVLAACGRGEPGPTAAPATVVRAAPDATLAAGSATVQSSGPYVSAEGTVEFASGRDDLKIAGRDTTSIPWGVTQPVAALDLLRGVVRIDAYGGSQVQGIGTKRYQLDVDLNTAIRATPENRRADLLLLEGKLGADNLLWVDVFVDSAGLVRRILLPVRTASERPYGDSKLIPQLVSVDFFDFGKAAR